jgi:hypothetical protein
MASKVYGEVAVTSDNMLRNVDKGKNQELWWVLENLRLLATAAQADIEALEKRVSALEDLA